jgi:hypothetical protein
MGLDFRIDESPRFKIDLHDGQGEQEIDYRNLATLFEYPPEIDWALQDHTPHPEDISEISVEIIRREPLPEELSKSSGNFQTWPRWAYSGFGRFRENLAREVGIDLRLMEGFAPHDYELISYAERYGLIDAKSQYNEEVAERVRTYYDRNMIRWDSITESHPAWDLVPLLNHSDCEGTLSPEECERVAPTLKAIVSKWPEDDYDRQSALNLVRYMEICVAFRRDLIFC